jgi:hypothetical protein
MKENHLVNPRFRGKYFFAIILFSAAVMFTSTFIQAGEKAADDTVDTSNTLVYFCGKRGDLTAPQCAVLLGEYSMKGQKGHVFVCSKDSRTFGCVSGLCEELSTFVSRIENNYTSDKFPQLCELLCGPCKPGWR